MEAFVFQKEILFDTDCLITEDLVNGWLFLPYHLLVVFVESMKVHHSVKIKP